MTINRIDAIDPGSHFDKIFEIVSDYNIINYSPKSKNSQITGDASGRLPRRASVYGRNIGFQKRPPSPKIGEDSAMTVKLLDFPDHGSGNR
jgi:hypothetical protein